ncbi:hypothetical protein RhiJN_25934 [Ceratobasidium sp. AG-Ba]|nr:hypothetical protein RhiJN_25934 [Ceratobasidium sp. AG-Ba]
MDVRTLLTLSNRSRVGIRPALRTTPGLNNRFDARYNPPPPPVRDTPVASIGSHSHSHCRAFRSAAAEGRAIPRSVHDLRPIPPSRQAERPSTWPLQGGLGDVYTHSGSVR